ncbi:MAG TPA: hypothetical protein VG013_33970 [Gemmataceae bacterium]|nr:hypothetical protein [Gemmataceae bacterium]
MDDRRALLVAWVEGEGERQRRPVLPPAQSKDLAVRGWVQVGVCALGGALASALFVCWLATAWHQAMRVTLVEELRLEGFRRVTGDPYRPALPPAWWRGGGVTAKSNGGALWVFLCLRVFAILLGTVIGAVFLRAACAFYNKLAGGKGSPSSVPEPLLGKAMGITFVTALVNAVPGFELLSLPVSLLVLAGMISALLPTTFARGLLVALCYLVVGLFVLVVLAILFVGFFLAGPPLR